MTILEAIKNYFGPSHNYVERDDLIFVIVPVYRKARNAYISFKNVKGYNGSIFNYLHNPYGPSVDNDLYTTYHLMGIEYPKHIWEVKRKAYLFNNQLNALLDSDASPTTKK